MSSHNRRSLLRVSRYPTNKRWYFVNSIHYIAKFSGSKPYVFRKESSRVNAPTLAYVVSDKGFANRQKQAQRINDKIDAVKAKEMAGIALTENEKTYYKNLKNKAPTRIDALKKLPKDLVQKFADQWNSYLHYYEENIGYIKPAKRAFHYEFDRDVQELGIANNDPKLLEVCVEKLLKKQDVARAQRILERYTTQNFEHPKDWKKWLDKNRDRLFFSDTGGYKFRIKQ